MSAGHPSSSQIECCTPRVALLETTLFRCFSTTRGGPCSPPALPVPSPSSLPPPPGASDRLRGISSSRHSLRTPPPPLPSLPHNSPTNTHRNTPARHEQTPAPLLHLVHPMQCYFVDPGESAVSSLSGLWARRGGAGRGKERNLPSRRIGGRTKGKRTRLQHAHDESVSHPGASSAARAVHTYPPFSLTYASHSRHTVPARQGARRFASSGPAASQGSSNLATYLVRRIKGSAHLSLSLLARVSSRLTVGSIFPSASLLMGLSFDLRCPPSRDNIPSAPPHHAHPARAIRLARHRCRQRRWILLPLATVPTDPRQGREQGQGGRPQGPGSCSECGGLGCLCDRSGSPRPKQVPQLQAEGDQGGSGTLLWCGVACWKRCRVKTWSPCGTGSDGGRRRSDVVDPSV